MAMACARECPHGGDAQPAGGEHRGAVGVQGARMREEVTGGERDDGAQANRRRTGASGGDSVD
jgi:hypothetical protein